MEKAITAKESHLKVASVQQAIPQELSVENQIAFHRRLQTTLDIKQLINLFNDKLKELFQINSLDYKHLAQNIIFTTDRPAHHKCRYLLNLEGTDLGEISITRSKRFSEMELSLLEQSIGLLPCYLKNALEYQQLKKTAFTDGLTGAMNRTALEELLPREIERAERYDNCLSLLMLDLDNFKDCNDKVGHLGGDEVLCQVIKIIQQKVRFSDLIFRYGGEEFLIILPHADLSGAVLAGELIRKAVNELTLYINEQIIRPSISVGAASHQKGEDKSQIINNADKALYQAKINGRNRTCCQ